MRRTSRCTVFVIFDNAHKIAEVRFAFKKGFEGYGKNRKMHCFLISLELKTACFSQSSSVKNGTLRAFLRKRENVLLGIQNVPARPNIPYKFENSPVFCVSFPKKSFSKAMLLKNHTDTGKHLNIRIFLLSAP